LSILRAVVSLLLAGVILWRNLPGALLCLWPGLMRARKGAADESRVDGALFDQMEAELAPLGFRRLGVHFEKAPLRRATLNYDFVNEAEGTFASAFCYGRHVRLYLLSAFEDGGFVLTADHRRMGIEREGYLSGGLPGALPEQLLAAHKRRVERMHESGHALVPDLSLDARVSAAERWFDGVGASETRLRQVNALLLSLIGAVILVAVAAAALRGH
jgi:hypothetical protein